MHMPLRPYLAIIKDSFREAFVSRVLWILLVLCTLLLLALAPLGIREQSATDLMPGDLLDGPAMAAKIVAQGGAEPASPGKRIWSLADAGFQRVLSELAQRPTDQRSARRLAEELRDRLNGLLRRSDFFDRDSWAYIALRPEARDLRRKSSKDLKEAEIRRLNRLLLEDAFPDQVARSRQTELYFSYAWFHAAQGVPGDKEPLVASFLSPFMQFFVGVVGVLVAVLVTASIIPHTFEPGAIDLLLSKPVSRALVFLTKFSGGCAFILVVASYMIGGVFLIMGLRFEIWNWRFLLSIPVFLFLFAIYYGVSALAGLVWRNAIVSVVMTIVFWALCFGIGFTKGWMERLSIDPSRVVQVVQAGDSLVAVNEAAEVYAWSAELGRWQETFRNEDPNQVQIPFGLRATRYLGPVYDRQGDRLLAVETPIRGMEMLQPSSGLLVGRRITDGWKRAKGIAVPPGTDALLMENEGNLLAITPTGILRLRGNPDEQKETVKVFGFDVPLGGGGSARFLAAGSRLRLATPLSVATDDPSRSMAIYDGNELLVLRKNDVGRYSVKRKLAPKFNKAGVVGFGGGTVLLATEDGGVHVYDDALRVKSTHQPEGANQPRFAAVSPDGNWLAVLFHNRRLWLYNVQKHEQVRTGIVGQGEISYVAFPATDRLRVVDRADRVSDYKLGSFELAERWQPPLGWLDKVYRYAVNPLYTVFPKPGKLNDVVLYLLTGQETKAQGQPSDLNANRTKLDVWGSIWTNLAFLSVVLGIGCAYVYFKDF